MLTLITATPTFAIPHVENQDAGVTQATAQLIPAGRDGVTGILRPGTGTPFDINPPDVDVFSFVLTAPTTAVSIEVNSTFDNNLLLLRQGFVGLWGDDDSGTGLNARIDTNLTPGTYFIAIGRNNIGAYDNSNVVAWSNDSGSLTPTQAAARIALVGVEGSGTTNNEPYTVSFNFQTSTNLVISNLTAISDKQSVRTKIRKALRILKQAKRSGHKSQVRRSRKQIKKLKRKLNAL